MNPTTTAESFAHAINTRACGLGPAGEIHMEIERKDGPARSDCLLVLTRDQASLLVKNLLQSIEDTQPAAY